MPTTPYAAEDASTGNVLPTDSRQALLRGLQQKRQIIHEVIEGHLPLIEAAAQFEAAQQASTECFERVTGVSTATDGESICRTVIGWVHLILRDRPEQAERISQQLETELQGYLQVSGDVNLSLRC